MLKHLIERMGISVRDLLREKACDRGPDRPKAGASDGGEGALTALLRKLGPVSPAGAPDYAGPPVRLPGLADPSAAAGHRPPGRGNPDPGLFQSRPRTS